MSQILKNLKDLIKTEAFTILFIVFISATLVYLLVKSPTIKTTTEIQLDGTELIDSTTIQVDSISTDSL
jgi:hypothetical protein